MRANNNNNNNNNNKTYIAPISIFLFSSALNTRKLAASTRKLSLNREKTHKKTCMGAK